MGRIGRERDRVGQLAFLVERFLPVLNRDEAVSVDLKQGVGCLTHLKQ
jgi:hypothetical protein